MYEEDNEIARKRNDSEEFQCRSCGEWFPMDHMKDGYCPNCWEVNYEEDFMS